MQQQKAVRLATVQVLVAILAAFTALAIVVAPRVADAQAVPDRRNVSANEEANGLPIWYQDASAHRVFQCLGNANLCAIEPPDPGAPPEPPEVTYWAAETSMPVGNAGGEALLVMAVEGAEDPDAGNAPITGAVISIRAEGLRPLTPYRVSHPYGSFRIRSNGQGELPRNANTLVEHGCDIEVGQNCNFRAALRSPLFDNFLRPANVPWSTTRTHLSNPEASVRVVGSLVRDANNRPQNYFEIEGPAAGGAGDTVARSNRFSVTAQLERDTDLATP